MVSEEVLCPEPHVGTDTLLNVLGKHLGECQV
jgi:hypothetical protein